MDKIEGTRVILALKTKLQIEMEEHRQARNTKAAQIRAINKIISPEDIKDLEEFDELQKAFSLKGVAHLIFAKKETHTEPSLEDSLKELEG